MLTEKGLYERKWGRYPSLGTLLGKHPVPQHYYGWSSISDNVFNRLTSVVEVALITEEHAALLRDTTDPQLIQRLPEDLHALERELQGAAHFFTEQAKVIRSLLHEGYQRKDRQLHEE